MTTHKNQIRLQKHIAASGLCSRRAAEKIIAEGRVQVNGQTAPPHGCLVDPDKDHVKVDGKQIFRREKKVLLLYKPVRVISTKNDPEGRETIMDYLPPKFHYLNPVGRLDYDSQGLMVFTNDGEIANKLLHPRYELSRKYLVKIRGRLSSGVDRRFQKGIELEDGLATGRIRIRRHVSGSTEIEVEVKEGRNRMVRRMFDAVDHPVQDLKRISHGSLSLGKLRIGEYRVLSREEYNHLKEQLL